MDRESLLELITIEDIIKLMQKFGANEYKKDSSSDGLIFPTICHNSDSHKFKLYYYPSTKLFHCYTSCGSMSLYDFIMKMNGWREDDKGFSKAYQFLAEFKGVNVNGVMSKGRGFITRQTEIEDIDFLDKHLYTPHRQKIQLPAYNENVLKIFSNYYPSTWEDEGISPEEMEYFGIKCYFNQKKAIIPNRDINGRLIGIRGRSFSREVVEQGKKYMPVTIQGLTYRCPTGVSLYGIYENKDNIQRLKKAFLWEGEKSVYHQGTFLGRRNNTGVATLGTNFTTIQRDMLLDLGVEEVVICYDKQFEWWRIDKKEKEAIKEYNDYIRKLMKIYKLFAPYCTVSVLYCNDDEMLGYKDAPCDKGKETFLELYRDRVILNLEMLEGEIIK
nr:MAG TPA: DNA primase [Caudoviricetes sp.]